MSHKTPFEFLQRARAMPERAISVLRTNIPKVCCANLGPRSVFPNPAPSGRPLTKGAFLQKTRSGSRRIA